MVCEYECRVDSVMFYVLSEKRKVMVQILRILGTVSQGTHGGKWTVC
jgi:hypothetical protein